MNDKPPSTSGTRATGVFKRVIRAIKSQPWSREEIHDLLQQAESVFDPDEQEMLSGVIEVAETQVREVMVPRSQMVVIERDHSLDQMLELIIQSGHSRFPVIGEDRDDVLRATCREGVHRTGRRPPRLTFQKLISRSDQIN